LTQEALDVLREMVFLVALFHIIYAFARIFKRLLFKLSLGLSRLNDYLKENSNSGLLFDILRHLTDGLSLWFVKLGIRDLAEVKRFNIDLWDIKTAARKLEESGNRMRRLDKRMNIRWHTEMADWNMFRRFMELDYVILY
jgi:hypothetical protein